MQELDKRMLQLLTEAQGTILDDESLITTLNSSKAMSDIVSKR